MTMPDESFVDVQQPDSSDSWVQKLQEIVSSMSASSPSEEVVQEGGVIDVEDPELQYNPQDFKLQSPGDLFLNPPSDQTYLNLNPPKEKIDVEVKIPDSVKNDLTLKHPNEKLEFNLDNLNNYMLKLDPSSIPSDLKVDASEVEEAVRSIETAAAAAAQAASQPINAKIDLTGQTTVAINNATSALIPAIQNELDSFQDSLKSAIKSEILAQLPIQVRNIVRSFL